MKHLKFWLWYLIRQDVTLHFKGIYKNNKLDNELLLNRTLVENLLTSLGKWNVAGTWIWNKYLKILWKFLLLMTSNWNPGKLTS